MNNQIFYFFYNLSHIPFIANLSVFLSYPFTYLILFLLIIWAMFFSKRKMFNFSLLFTSALFSWIMAEVLKNILRINRPFITEGIVPLVKETDFSFPSGHMAVFTAIAISMFFIDRRAGLVFFIIAILIGLSRIVIGVHYPVDLVGGFVVGLLISLITIEIFKKV